ncbi:MAG: histidine--tRNA ligase [Candidatus Muproteobacteria bacterium RIFCSPHIGHO2_02_FULL_65_16]|uniref:Histidine--tRNA ligase n=1 Tax=Candidatus Muproteobacteria bacterium RIFCSPHIGHO2_02_FULL_65_16 TaxID=1817766 RepID=A0A1F6TXW6_9PROT|nr:MAG: histidine--tRNA ligase [Candidatus Muproteobacteria bacterium RIFCSPHIGHO2_02_FULL_65_16]
MSKVIQAVRGMNDLLPDAVERWQRIEGVARAVLAAYGYREIRFPVVEKTELFARSIGSLTDIVEKEMYTFEDSNHESLTLRPEGTAGCVRAGIENGLLHNQVQRFWYGGPMFRHERPQKGRYRQFHQIGVEAFGMEGPDVDVEQILMCVRLWRALGVDGLTLQINSLGTPAARAAYRKVLVRYLETRRAELDADSLRRLDKNPLRILDSKNPAMQDVIAGAPELAAHLDDESRAHFAQLRALLDGAGVRYEVNPRLVRGLDYYTRTVFEWASERLGAQSAVCAGGRYDGLVELLGGRPAPAAGFALGLERLVELLSPPAGAPANAPQVYLALIGASVVEPGLKLAESLRDLGLRVECNCGGGSLTAQIKRADRSGARFALLLGQEEHEQHAVAVKDLRAGAGQELVGLAAVGDYLRRKLA